MSRDLARLLRPASVAVIGGASLAAHVIANCRKLGFAGPVWPVHPSRAEIAGLPVFASVDALPGLPDAVLVGINRTAAVQTVADLAARGAGGAVVYASGFREAEAETGDGGALQDALVAAAGAMPVIGPNCYGLVNYLDGAGLWPDQQGGRRVTRGVALVTQSSNIAINLTMQRRGLPVAYVATAGNGAQTGLAELAQALLADDRVTALGLHVEGIGDIPAIEALAAAARRRGVPVVGLKPGASVAARAAAVSHSASLAGSEAGAEALLTRLGIARVRSLGALLETLMLLHVVGPLASARIAALSCSGGEAALAADAGAARGLVFPPPDAAARRALATALGPRVALANPLDYHTYVWGDGAAMAAAFGAAMQGDLALGAVIADFPRDDRCDPSDWEPVIAATGAAAAATGRPMAILSSLPEGMPEAVADRLVADGLVPLSGLEDGFDAIAAAAWLGQSRKRPVPAPVLPPLAPRAPASLTEAAGKKALAAHGLTIPRGRQARRDEVVDAASAIGFPVALKAAGSDHKTEAGAVALDLRTPGAVADAAAAMLATDFLVEEMIADGVAELLVGVVIDPAHGYLLTLAAGGTLTELWRDSRTLLVPAGPADIADALAALRAAPLLHGYRGRPAANLPAIVAAVQAVQAYVIAEHGRVAEVEVNPLICTPDRAVAADVLIRLGERP